MKRILISMSVMLAMMATTVSAESRILIAYFSWGGNTQALAEEIRRQTGADMFRIEPVTPYSTDYNTVANITSVEERRTGARPAIKDTIPNLDAYDYVFIGTPVWWMEDPMIIHTFMETPQYNGFEGKTIIPFCTYFSGASSALSDIVAGTPRANHLEGYSTRGSSSYNSSAISQWLSRIGVPDVVNGLNDATINPTRTDNTIYTLDGRVIARDGNLNNLPKGLYIANGKKVLVR